MAAEMAIEAVRWKRDILKKSTSGKGGRVSLRGRDAALQGRAQAGLDRDRAHGKLERSEKPDAKRWLPQHEALAFNFALHG
jgi:hypothetical protein